MFQLNFWLASHFATVSYLLQVVFLNENVHLLCNFPAGMKEKKMLKVIYIEVKMKQNN